MAQIFATDFGWSRSYPMSSKSQAHDALSLLFAREGIPPKIIVDNAKEMKLGEFAQKCKEVTCYLRGTEPYSPWSNSTECEIRELKKGAARKLTQSGDWHELAWVLRWKSDSNGVPVGTANKQPAINTRIYEVHFPDGHTKELVMNTIAEALYDRCNPDGNQYIMLDTIVDFRKNPDVAISRNNQVKIVNVLMCHMIFDVKMENFRRKARLVAGGLMTKAPATLTYANVVSRETVWIALLVAVLNNMDIWAADVLNTYITASREKIWTTLGKEFGDDCGR
ncbi:hypothetical protein ACHAW6_000796, partial [Cyclotella cf. meneghiniana]